MKTKLNKVQGAADEKSYDPMFMNSEDFSRATFPSDWLIEGILMNGQPGVVGGPQKTLKTSVAVDVAISLGAGKPFLGRFQVPQQRRVAMISGESGEAALQDLAKRVARAKKVSLENCDVLWSSRLPRLGNLKDRNALRHSLRARKVEVVIIDPLYLCLLDGAKGLSAANLYEVGPLLHRAGEACLAAGATPVFLHHSTKAAGRQTLKPGTAPALDDLAFAGVAEYMRQWILLARHEPFRPGSGQHRLVMAVGGSSGHSGVWNLDVSEGTGGKGRRWQVHLSEFGHADGDVKYDSGGCDAPVCFQFLSVQEKKYEDCALRV
jgi:replicative DNA helicase